MMNRQEYMKSAGDLIREWMSERDISQRELSRNTGLSQAFISMILSKKNYLSIKNALLLEKYTGIGAKELLIADIEYKIDKLRSQNGNRDL